MKTLAGKTKAALILFSVSLISLSVGLFSLTKMLIVATLVASAVSFLSFLVAIVLFIMDSKNRKLRKQMMQDAASKDVSISGIPEAKPEIKDNKKAKKDLAAGTGKDVTPLASPKANKNAAKGTNKKNEQQISRAIEAYKAAAQEAGIDKSRVKISEGDDSGIRGCMIGKAYNLDSHFACDCIIDGMSLSFRDIELYTDGNSPVAKGMFARVKLPFTIDGEYVICGKRFCDSSYEDHLKSLGFVKGSKGDIFIYMNKDKGKADKLSNLAAIFHKADEILNENVPEGELSIHFRKNVADIAVENFPINNPRNVFTKLKSFVSAL